jgi:hypothetical protein
MALPTSYLTSAKNLGAIFTAMQQAKAPERFTVRFLESLGFKSNTDRLIIGVLKAIGFLDDQGKPTGRYFEFLDQTQSKRVLAEGIQEAYRDLFEVNTGAHKLDRGEVKNKFKTLSQGQYGESVIDKMALTFAALVALADFSGPAKGSTRVEDAHTNVELDSRQESAPTMDTTREVGPEISWGGLHYNIQIILPESRDPKVYDALFRSLREHL